MYAVEFPANHVSAFPINCPADSSAPAFLKLKQQHSGARQSSDTAEPQSSSCRRVPLCLLLSFPSRPACLGIAKPRLCSAFMLMVSSTSMANVSTIDTRNMSATIKFLRQGGSPARACFLLSIELSGLVQNSLEAIQLGYHSGRLSLLELPGSFVCRDDLAICLAFQRSRDEAAEVECRADCSAGSTRSSCDTLRLSTLRVKSPVWWSSTQRQGRVFMTDGGIALFVSIVILNLPLVSCLVVSACALELYPSNDAIALTEWCCMWLAG